jgi:hypothetical protein
LSWFELVITLDGKNCIGDQVATGGGDAFHARNPLDRAELEPAFRAACTNEANAAMEPPPGIRRLLNGKCE